MRWILVVLVVVMLGFVSSVGIDDDVIGEFREGEKNVDVIVELKNDSLEIGAFQLDNCFDSLDDVIDEEKITYRFENSIAVEINERDLDVLSRSHNVESVVKMGKIYALLQDSVGIINVSSTWGLESSGVGLTGVGQSVCVIDSGINYSHPDLIGNYLGGYDFVDDDDDPMDGFGHGTHVAGIVAASGGISGVVPGVGIVAVRVLDNSGGGNPGDLASAIDWCVDNAPQFNISVISMSLGCNATADGYNSYCDSVDDGCFNSAIANSINVAVANNISVVAASGNFGSVEKISSPACIQNVIAVSSIDKNGLISSFADRNFLVNLLAPGRDINSTYFLGGYAIASGTSMATPMVAGVIGLINQYLSLSGQSKTPTEIESILNNTGRRINDSGSGLSFSVVDVYAAILSLDVDAPEVALVSPVNYDVDMNANRTFVCNATDWQLASLSLNIWNSSGLYYNATGNGTSFNVANMSEGNYFWNCLGVDVVGNSAYASANFSLTIGGISTMLLLPADNKYANVNDMNFSCRVVSEENYFVSNVTFYLWNSSGGLANSSVKNISGFDNASIFNYSFADEGNYLWNCLGVNNASNSSWGDFNYSFVFDVTAPVVSSLSESVGVSGATISWTTDESANFSVGGEISGSSSSYATNHSIVISGLSPSTTYNYVLVSCDGAGNCVNRSDSFVTGAVVNPVSFSGGGGSSASVSFVPKIYEVGVDEIKFGYVQKLEKDDRVNFSIFDFEGGRHLLSIDEIEVDYVELTIESEPIKLKLGVGQSVKLNLTSVIYYDLFVRLNAIVGDAAELTIQLINEPIEIRTAKITGNVVENEDGDIENYSWAVAILVIVFVLIVLIFSVIKRKRLKSSKSKEKNGERKKIKT
ncbi:MAG: S8 family serine peptidase [archaeon]